MNVLEKMGHIVDGYTNLLKDELGQLPERERELYAPRWEKCRVCAMRDGNTCSTKRMMKHVVTGEYVEGCGCQLAASTKAPGYSCPAGKWGPVTHLLKT